MDTMTVVLWFVGQLVVGAAIWGGIRADVRALHRQDETLRSELTEQRVRMDRHLETVGLHPKIPS